MVSPPPLSSTATPSASAEQQIAFESPCHIPKILGQKAEFNH